MNNEIIKIKILDLKKSIVLGWGIEVFFSIYSEITHVPLFKKINSFESEVLG
jgi:hypothetical protein